MNRAENVLRAMEEIETGCNVHTCAALCPVSEAFQPELVGMMDLRREYGRLFAPTPRNSAVCWLEDGEWAAAWKVKRAEMKEWRLTALAFLLAMVEAGDV